MNIITPEVLNAEKATEAGSLHHKAIDTLGRGMRDLRISVTDRCNFRCVYCMPKELFGSDHAFLPRKALLSFEEIVRVATAFAWHGVKKLRITGGEPLVRKEIEHLIGSLAGVNGIEDISLTTNGSLLTPAKATALKQAGLSRITISLDAINDFVFAKINDVKFPVSRVLEAVENAQTAGLNPVKVNMVVARGMNEEEILPMAKYFRNSGAVLRFIEYMDVGTSNGWKLDQVISAQEIIATINNEFPLETEQPQYGGEVAKRWRYKDGAGEIGVITSVTQPFCSDCTRARLSAEGQLYTCLFATKGFDLRDALRSDLSDAQLIARLAKIWSARSDRYSEIRSDATVTLPKIEMSYIGG